MTKTLRPMVEQCILNQTKKYWLFSNALFTTFSIYDRLHRDYQVQISWNPPLMCEKFEAKLEILYNRMGLEMINMLDPFLAYVTWPSMLLLCTTCVFSNLIQDSRACIHYYQSGVQFTSLNHYGTLKVK
jgi:hypothetical protein